MDNASLPPTGDLSIDPTRDTPQALGAVFPQNSDSGYETNEVDGPMVMRLGTSVVRRWPTLPRDVQEALFEGAVAEATDEDREALARFLHEKANGMSKNPAVETLPK